MGSGLWLKLAAGASITLALAVSTSCSSGGEEVAGLADGTREAVTGRMPIVLDKSTNTNSRLSVKTDGTALYRLPHAPGLLSPDSKRIATANKGGIGLALADGGGEVHVQGGISAILPEWSPDSRELAVVLAGSPASIFAGDSDESVDLVDAASGGVVAAFSPPEHLIFGAASWSPDSKRFALVQNKTLFSADLIVLDESGKAATFDARIRPGTAPAWSNDGKRVAFETTALHQPYHLAALDIASGQFQQITDGSAYDEEPSWSPSGKQIAFWRRSDLDQASATLCLVSSDGGAVKELTDIDAPRTSPFWSPDGTKIAFWASLGTTSGIYVVRSDGSNLYQLVEVDAPRPTTLRWLGNDILSFDD